MPWSLRNDESFSIWAKMSLACSSERFNKLELSFISKKFISLRTSECTFEQDTLTHLLVLLPLMSNVSLVFDFSKSLTVFYITMKSRSGKCFVLIVKIPYILARRDWLFELSMWTKYSSRMWSISFFSGSINVLIKNLLSWEKKKNWPLAPAPYPDLNTWSMLACRDNDSSKSDGLMPSNFKILANILCLWEIIFDLMLILSNFVSFKLTFYACLFSI